MGYPIRYTALSEDTNGTYALRGFAGSGAVGDTILDCRVAGSIATSPPLKPIPFNES